MGTVGIVGMAGTGVHGGHRWAQWAPDVVGMEGVVSTVGMAGTGVWWAQWAWAHHCGTLPTYAEQCEENRLEGQESLPG